MNKLIQATVLLIAIFYCNIDSVQSLNCVVCSACTNPWTNSTDPIETCPAGSDKCLKTNIAYPSGGIMIKSCVPSASCSDQEIMIFGYGFSMTCCNTDGCNSASSIEMKSFVLLASILITLFFSMLQN